MICYGDKKCRCENCHTPKPKPIAVKQRRPIRSVYQSGLSGFADAWDENPPAEFHR